MMEMSYTGMKALLYCIIIVKLTSHHIMMEILTDENSFGIY